LRTKKHLIWALILNWSILIATLLCWLCPAKTLTVLNLILDVLKKWSYAWSNKNLILLLSVRSNNASSTVFWGMSPIAVGSCFLPWTKRVSVGLYNEVLLDTLLKFRRLTLDYGAMTIFVLRFLLPNSSDRVYFGFLFRRCILLARIPAMTGSLLEIKVVVFRCNIVIHITKSNRYSYVYLIKSSRMTVSFHQIFSLCPLICCLFFSFKLFNNVMRFIEDII
jgi:hypothetical protein